MIDTPTSSSGRARRRLRLGSSARPEGVGVEPTTDHRRLTRREQILAIAAELFAEEGFSGITVGDIGAAAGVSGPALYHHFENKEAILGEMLVDISQHLYDAGHRIRAEVEPERVLPELIAMHVDFAVGQPALISVHFRNLLQASDDDRRRVRTLQRQYVEIWVDAVVSSRPAVPRPTARAAVHAVLNLINSTPFSPRVKRSDLVPLLGSMATTALAAI